MAAIEKICEFSDNYTGPEMYGYKRNHIQIESQYRKNFRGKKAVLTFKEIEMALKSKNGYTLFYNWIEERDFLDERYYGIPQDKLSFERLLKKEFKKTPVQRYEYCLEIIDENWSCPTGRTKFYETTFDNPKHIIRRMKRLVGAKNLTVVMPDGKIIDPFHLHLVF